MERFNFELNVLNGELADTDYGTVYGSITAIGDTLEDLLDNATIAIEDPHGNELDYVHIGDLKTEGQLMVAEKAIVDSYLNAVDEDQEAV